MRYIKNGRVSQDQWVRVADDADVPNDKPAIVTASRLLAAGEDISERKAPLGVIWPNHEPVTALHPHLERLALVVLNFPVFRDGRAYTQARQLRDQFGFEGEIRAAGDVLRDQFLFMARAGFDAFEVKKDADAEAFAEALLEFTVLYQPASQVRVPAFRAHIAPHRPGAAVIVSFAASKT